MADYSAILERFSLVRATASPTKWQVRCPGPNHKNGDRNPSGWAWVSEKTGDLMFRCSKKCLAKDAGKTRS